MKPYSLLLTFSLMVSTGFCQSWCTPGSVWHFADASAFEQGYKRLDYLYDTLIGGKSCNKIKAHFLGFGSFGWYNSIYYLYTFTSNQVVYIKDVTGSTTDFDTLYNFNAVPGGKWRMPPVSRAQCKASYIQVTDTGHSIIQGQNLKWFSIKYLLNAPNTVSKPGNDIVYERLGALDTYPYLPGNICATGTDQDGGGPLRCFSDYQIINYKRNYTGPCDYIFDAEPEINSPHSVKIFPNPGNGLFSLSCVTPGFLDKSTISITDVCGRIIKKTDVYKENECIDMSEYSNGMYTVTISKMERLFIETNSLSNS